MGKSPGVLRKSVNHIAINIDDNFQINDFVGAKLLRIKSDEELYGVLPTKNESIVGNGAVFQSLVSETEAARTWLESNTGDFYAITTDHATGETWQPIGGGPGYTDIATTGDYIVTTKQQLLDAISLATSGETIFIPGSFEIDVSNCQMTIPAGVTLASTRGYGNSEGALLYSNTKYPLAQGNAETEWTFRSGGTGVRITGLRLKGPEAERIGNTNEESANAIKLLHKSCEVDNCEITDWMKWGLLVADNELHKIHHNLFANTTMEGFGYGVWFKGTGQGESEPDYANISHLWGNMFFSHRHHIASGSQDESSFFAYNNYIVTHNMGNHQVDRHGSLGSTGGHVTEVFKNVMYEKDAEKLGGSKAVAAPGGHIWFNDNYYSGLGIITSMAPYVDENLRNTTDFLPDFDNNIPSVTVSPVQIEVEIGESFTLTATGTDKNIDDVGPIKSYIWEFNQSRTRKLTTTNKLTLSYNEKGHHIVSVRSVNRFGVPSIPRSCSIQVKQAAIIPDLHVQLVDWWTFNGATPLIGAYNNKTFTPSGSGSFTSDGIIDGAYTAGADDKLKLKGPETEGFSLYDQDLTFAFWYFRTGGGGADGIMGDATNLIAFTNWQVDGQNDDFNWGLAMGVWQFNILEMDRFVQRKVWQDNVVAGSTAINPGSSKYHARYNQEFELNYDPSVNGMTGRYSEFACWRRKLTSAEKTWLYNSGSGRTFSDIT